MSNMTMQEAEDIAQSIRAHLTEINRIAKVAASKGVAIDYTAGPVTTKGNPVQLYELTAQITIEL